MCNQNGYSRLAPPPQPIIELRRVGKTYAGLAGAVTALKRIDLQVYPGEFLVVTGKSGAGKTTLVNLIAGLDRCTTGEIYVAGTAVHTLSSEAAARWRGQTVGVVFQTFDLLPGLTVLQNVMLPMDFAQRYPISEQQARAQQLLAQLSIAEHSHKPPTAVSGGQQQRVAIARALANDPPILVADEPTGSLDSVTAAAVLQIFAELVAEGKTVVLVTHDPDIAHRGYRTLQLVDGEIVDCPDAAILSAPVTSSGGRK